MSNLATDSPARIFLDSKYSRRDNLILNGDMRIDQRNSGAAVALAGAAVYTLDRWAARTDTGAGNTAQQSTDVPTGQGFTHSLVITAGAGAAPAVGAQNYLRQSLEGLVVSPAMFGQPQALTLGLGFWAKSSLTGRFGVALVNGAANRSYPAEIVIPTAGVWAFYPLWLPGDQTGTWATDNTAGIQLYFDLGSGTNYEGATNAWQAADYRRASGQVKLVQTAGATLHLTGVQLLFDTVDSTFPFRSYIDELDRCFRYCERKICNVPAAPDADPLYYYTRKRATPTITGGGAGFATAVLTEDAAYMNQTVANTQTLLIDAEL